MNSRSIRTRTCIYNKNDDLQELKDIINSDKKESDQTKYEFQAFGKMHEFDFNDPILWVSEAKFKGNSKS